MTKPGRYGWCWPASSIPRRPSSEPRPAVPGVQGSAPASTSRPFLRWRHSPARYACAVPEDIQASLDASRPSIARIYDYWLGGKDNFRSDREEAERVLAVYPPLKQMVRQNRLFL